MSERTKIITKGHCKNKITDGWKTSKLSEKKDHGFKLPSIAFPSPPVVIGKAYASDIMKAMEDAALYGRVIVSFERGKITTVRPEFTIKEDVKS